MTLDYWCRKILPIGAIAAMCLSTGNIPYLWLSVRLRACLVPHLPKHKGCVRWRGTLAAAFCLTSRARCTSQSVLSL
jgi:hypothetical protein